ncbi:Hypothetical predicted protein [Cloeon dipterum]|uniref:Uncharacterized protein n=1 Tax=Cloeon dipterum TaxID=197152 RepID=A0A8S1DXN5_9INSE|nr:Hypothetical predicted protein [Cloeon dipterum]
MMIFALLLIFASIALKNCTPTDSPAGGVKTWKNVTDLLEVSYDLINLQDKTDFILIIGDLDGERCELSRFLRNDLAPVEKDTLTFPHYDVDWESDTVIIDLPSFDEEKDNIVADIMHAFINKIIFERAERLKIVIVVPDSASNLYVSF